MLWSLLLRNRKSDFSGNSTDRTSIRHCWNLRHSKNKAFPETKEQTLKKTDWLALCNVKLRRRHLTFLHAETGIFNLLLHYILNTLHARSRNKRSIYYIEKEITLDVVSARRQTGFSPVPIRFDKTSFILALHNTIRLQPGAEARLARYIIILKVACLSS